eukprot:TRINITY_DN24259_c0_g1_i1.p1 TRINITY_DN24259_c0_g1~~TRINITY_DN24259_c0_g1_i1.p1  ORF type:complete len:261 (-),score=18.59 TRINITY_DN24259_c0_g1_i1:43-750(-)
MAVAKHGKAAWGARGWTVQAMDSSCSALIVRSSGPYDGNASMQNSYSGLKLLVNLRHSPTMIAFPRGSVRPQRLLKLPVQASAGGGGEGGQPAGFGLGGPGTWFGFGRTQERAVGRLAMVGFVAAIVMEVLTGKGIFGQLGLDPVVVRYPFLAGIAFLFIGGLLGGQVVINNPPDLSKAPPNAGDGIKRDPLKTYDPNYLDPLTTYTRGGVVDRPTGQGREPYVSDLDTKEPPKE